MENSFTENQMIFFAQYCECKGFKPNVHSLGQWKESLRKKHIAAVRHSKQTYLNTLN